MAKSDLTTEARNGYASATLTNPPANPYLVTSPAWFAFVVGAYMQRTGRTEPRNVRMGRGYHVHCNEMQFAVHVYPRNHHAEVSRVE